MNTRRDDQDRVEVNPDILMGKPVIAGTCISVCLILNLLASGYTQERILEAYLGLTPEDIRADLQYAEQRMRFGKVCELPASPVPA